MIKVEVLLIIIANIVVVDNDVYFIVAIMPTHLLLDLAIVYLIYRWLKYLL